MKGAIFLVLAGLAVLGKAWALDLGTHGPVYGITESDFLQAITAKVQQKVESGEWARIQEEARARIAANVQTPPPVEGLAVSRAPRQWHFDPSIALSESITDQDGKILFPAGTRVNPLEVVDLPAALLFFDARDPAQIVVAEAVIDELAGAVTPILTGGGWAQLATVWQRRVYFDQSGILTHRFRIERVPALVTQDGLQLRIDELPVPAGAQ